MNRYLKTVAGSVLTSATLVACGSSGGTTTEAPPSGASSPAAAASPSAASPSVDSARAPNPVDVLKKAGVKPEAGSSVGTEGFNGERRAHGEYYASKADEATLSGEQVDVTTFPTNEALQSSGAVPKFSDDYHRYIVLVDRTFVSVTGLAGANGPLFPLPAETIAQRLGGQLVPRG